jgi:tetratricopeptide (TPR) repeat protein
VSVWWCHQTKEQKEKLMIPYAFVKRMHEDHLREAERKWREKGGTVYVPQPKASNLNAFGELEVRHLLAMAVLLVTLLGACAAPQVGSIETTDPQTGTDTTINQPVAEVQDKDSDHGHGDDAHSDDGHDHDHAMPDGSEAAFGEVSFAVSCTEEAQAEFNHAMALLHSFWFAPAINSFNTVAELDPTCGMAYWGIAMSLMGNPFTWPLAGQALVDGWAAVEQAVATGVQTPREQAYLDAVTLFYSQDGILEPTTPTLSYACSIEPYICTQPMDHRERSLTYTAAMERIVQDYPDDTEAQIFYALALNATALPTDKSYSNQLKAVEILEKIFTEQPNHPGIAHYLIHSYDYPPLAENGLDAAFRYAEIAPAAPHALHMPSHIFTRLGYWQESVEMNLASAQSAIDELSASHEQGAGSYNALHAMDYLMYAYLQMGQDAEAKKLLDQIYAIEQLDVENFVAAYAFAAMPARYALERGDWAAAAELTLHPQKLAWEKFPQAEAVLVFARGLGAARNGDVQAARGDLARLHELRDALAAANQGYWAGQTEIQIKQIEAWIALAEGDNEGAVALMREATVMEDATEKHAVMPGPVVPAHELFGEMLLIVDQPEEALVEFEKSQRIEPNRFRGWYGAAYAAHAAKASAFYEQLLVLCASADSERAEMAEARTYLGQS